MKAYWLARAKINDPVEYKKYADQVPGIIASHGGVILARGGGHVVLEGRTHYERFVVIEFESMEQAEKCHASAEYQAAAAHRRNGAGDNELVIVESVT